jgi:hypothetical protein
MAAMDRSALEESESRFASFVRSLNAVIGDRAVGVRSRSILNKLRANAGSLGTRIRLTGPAALPII